MSTMIELSVYLARIIKYPSGKIAPGDMVRVYNRAAFTPLDGGRPTQPPTRQDL